MVPLGMASMENMLMGLKPRIEENDIDINLNRGVSN